MGLRKQKVEKIYEIVDGNFSAHYCHITSHLPKFMPEKDWTCERQPTEANRYELPMLSSQGARGSSKVGRNQTNHKTCLVAGSQSKTWLGKTRA